jgi:hypothetical protein
MLDAVVLQEFVADELNFWWWTVMICLGYGVGYVLVCACFHFNSLNAEFNPICHLLALLGAHHILHVSRIRVNEPKLKFVNNFMKFVTS